MVYTAIKNGFPSANLPDLKKIVTDHTDTFRNSFSSSPPADIESLNVDLLKDSMPVRVIRRNYSHHYRNSLPIQWRIWSLVAWDIRILHLLGSLLHLSCPKLGPLSSFSVYLLLFNRFNVKHEVPIPNNEQGLSKLSGSHSFATFDFSHGYSEPLLVQSSQTS